MPNSNYPNYLAPKTLPTVPNPKQSILSSLIAQSQTPQSPQQTLSATAGATDNSNLNFPSATFKNPIRTIEDGALDYLTNLSPDTKQQIGEYVTSHVSPKGYHPFHLLGLLGPRNNPVKGTEDDLRQPLWRAYWGLDPQDTNNYYNIQGKNFSLNQNNPISQQYIPQFKGGQNISWVGVDKDKNIQQFPVPKIFKSTNYNWNQISGHFIPGQPDPWNFDLHPNEIPSPNAAYGPTSFMRQAMEQMTGQQNAPIVNTVYPQNQ